MYFSCSTSFLLLLYLPCVHLQFSAVFQASQFTAPESTPAEEDYTGLLQPLLVVQGEVEMEAKTMMSRIPYVKNRITKTSMFSYTGHNVSKTLTERLEALERHYGIGQLKESDAAIQGRRSRCDASTGYTWLEMGALCVRVDNHHTTWHFARDQCSQRGATLLKLDTWAKIHSIRSFLPQDSTKGFYIGANRLNGKGYNWQDGSELDEVTMWYNNQPSYYDLENVHQECVAILFDPIANRHFWDDIVCTEPQGYVCELS